MDYKAHQNKKNRYCFKHNDHLLYGYSIILYFKKQLIYKI